MKNHIEICIIIWSSRILELSDLQNRLQRLLVSLSLSAFLNFSSSSANVGQIGNFPHVLYNYAIIGMMGVQNAGLNQASVEDSLPNPLHFTVHKTKNSVALSSQTNYTD